MEAAVSLRDFWISVRIGAGLGSPRAVVDSATLDANQIESILRRADLWLTPKVVADFDEADFGFLSPEERNRLSQHVARFRAVASTVPGDEPAPNEQVREALPELLGILDIIRPDKYGDPDAMVLGKRLEQQVHESLPAWVRDLRVETGHDASGDPALWVWVEVEDAAMTDEGFTRRIRQVKTLLENALRTISPDRWHYVRFRTVSEQQAMSI
jgi:hypothetical protein